MPTSGQPSLFASTHAGAADRLDTARSRCLQRLQFIENTLEPSCFLPGIISLFIVSVGIIRNNSLVGGRARAESTEAVIALTPLPTQTHAWPTQTARVIPMIPKYTTPVGLPKICLAFDWPTQMKIPRTAAVSRIPVTVRVTLYCTWRPSALTIRPQGQVFVCMSHVKHLLRENWCS